ncbi:unnamed protein product [Vitrella brassicaformis CCMP3155]|uniref:Uncharacterized protein n=1 Tax=Vitrella brassicaformis (strain CCMP3155) TaxID=1169540 RepID=A0A0G4ECH4_VITBC|nr:unnamed protein product [Vitrella brassicaformis CCMP3155]|eukprot:CEL93429.1 unnamed protein product [Vitrella brassicaformis CCMP3155]
MEHSASGRHQEGTRVVLLSSTKRAPTDDYVWVTARVYRIDPHVVYEKEGTLHEGTALHMREVGGWREEFKVVVPHQTDTHTNPNPQPPVAPERFGEDIVASLLSFMTPRELSALFPPPHSTEPATNAIPDEKSRREKPILRVSRNRLSSVGGSVGTDPPLPAITSSPALPSTNGGPLCAGATFGPLKKGETMAASKEDTASRVLPGAASLPSPFGGQSLIGTSTGEGGLSSAAAAASSAAAIPTPKPSTDVLDGLRGAPSPASCAGPTTTTTAPMDRFGGSIFAPAKAATTSQSTVTPTSGPFSFGKASTGGGGSDLFGAGAASEGGSLFGEVGSSGSGTGRGSLFGQGGAATGTGAIFGPFGGSISAGTGVAASSVFSGASFSTGDSLSGGAAFGQQRPGGAAHSSPSPIYAAALHQQTHINIDCTTDADRHFWESMTPLEAFQLGKRLPNLTALSLVQPQSDRLWCLDSMISIVEGHADGRREACVKEGQHHTAKGSLETIDFTTTPISTSSTTSSVKQHRPPIPPSFAAPRPTLHALRAITGVVQQHSVLVHTCWKMPPLEYVDQEGWDADELGRFIRSSSSVKEVGGCRWTWGEWATFLEHFPVAPAGQPGPLRHLQTIGMIVRERGRDTNEKQLAGVRRLQDVLTSRGCRKSLTRLDVQIRSFESHDSLSALLAVDDLINNCCVSPDVPISVRSSGSYFDMSLFYADSFPPRPSPFIRTAIQEAARQAKMVFYTISLLKLLCAEHTPWSEGSDGALESRLHFALTPTASHRAAKGSVGAYLL